MKKLLSLAALFLFSVSPALAQSTSDPVVFTIDPPADPKPIISSIVPSHIQAGGNFNLTVHGSNFIQSSIVQWTPSAAGSSTTQLVTHFVDATQLSAEVPTSLMTTPGTANVTVLNGSQSSGGGGESGGGGGGDIVGLGHKVTLTWQKPAPDSCQTPPCAAVNGYNVFRSEVKGGPYDIMASVSGENTTTADDMWAAGGMTYYYVVASVTVDGGQSPFSNETKAVVPQDSKSKQKSGDKKHKPKKP